MLTALLNRFDRLGKLDTMARETINNHPILSKMHIHVQSGYHQSTVREGYDGKLFIPYVTFGDKGLNTEICICMNSINQIANKNKVAPEAFLQEVLNYLMLKVQAKQDLTWPLTRLTCVKN